MGLLTDLVDEKFKQKDQERQNKVTSYTSLVKDPNATPEAKEWAIQQLLGEANVPKQAHGLIGNMFGHLLGFKGQQSKQPNQAQQTQQPQAPAQAQQPQYNPASGQQETPAPSTPSSSSSSLPSTPPSRPGSSSRPGHFFMTDEEQQRRAGQEELSRHQATADFDLEQEKKKVTAGEEIKDKFEDVRLTQKLLRAKNLMQTEGLTKEEAYTTVGLPYKPEPVAKKQGTPVKTQDANGNAVQRQYYSDGTYDELPMPPDSGKPKLTGQLKELADAHSILNSKESTPEEKAAAGDFIKGVNARLQVVLNNPALATGRDAKDIAEGIMAGTDIPDLTGLARSGLGAKVRAEMDRAGYNYREAVLDWNAMKRYINSANSTQQLRLKQATEFSRESLDVLTDLIDDADKKVTRSKKYPIFNKASMLIAKNGGEGPEAQDAAVLLDNQVTELRNELATVYKGGNSATDQGLKQAMDLLDSSWTTSSLKQAIALAKKNLVVRLNSIQAIGATGINGPLSSRQGATGGGADQNQGQAKEGTFNPATGKVEYK